MIENKTPLLLIIIISLFISVPKPMHAEVEGFDSPNNRNSESVDHKNALPSGKNVTAITLLGFIPGAGQAYLGNYGSAFSQFFLFSASVHLASRAFHSQEYIPYSERSVDFDFEDAVIGEELNRRNLLYLEFPLFTESALARTTRMIKTGSPVETNPFIKYGAYQRFNRATFNSEVGKQTAFHALAYSIYSSYRDASGIRKDETYADLLRAPFRFDLITDPLVFVPAIVVGTITALGASRNQFPKTLVEPGMLASGEIGAYGSVALFNSGVGEEIFFRGFLNDALSRRTGPITGALISSTVFGLYHYIPTPGQSPSEFLMRFGHGLFLSYLQYRDGYDIQRAIANHFWFDFAYFVVFAATSFREDPAVAKNQRQVMFMPLFYTMQF